MEYTYTISRNCAATSPDACELRAIQAMHLTYQGAVDLPEGVEFAKVKFGGVEFTIFREDQWGTQNPEVK